jgi:hypothetical protein
MTPLKLIALDSDDLQVLSAHMQDAVFRVADMTYVKAERRFAAVGNRFDWTSVGADAAAQSDVLRRRTGLRLERVQKAEVSNLNLTSKDTVLSLLAIEFQPSDAPAGIVTLHFSGGAAIRLTVDYVEAEMKDLGAVWATSRVPTHGDDPASS